MNSHQNVAVFISGAGSNAKNLISYFSKVDNIKVRLLISEKENAELEKICNDHSIKFVLVSKDQTSNSSFLINICKKQDINWIILAGYLKKIPVPFIDAYPDHIFNIHPSLLPKFGGKGMYGDYVHQAVLNSKEIKSGISIHLVNEEYDKGEIIAQFSIEIDTMDTVDSLRQKIRNLEHIHFPKVIEHHIQNKAN